MMLITHILTILFIKVENAHCFHSYLKPTAPIPGTTTRNLSTRMPFCSIQSSLFSSTTSKLTKQSLHTQIQNRFSVRLSASSSPPNDDEIDEKDTRSGMSSAFEALDELTELDFLNDDDDNNNVDDSFDSVENKKEMKLSTSEIKTVTTNAESLQSPEDELKLYGEMYEELSSKGQTQMYDDVLSDLGGEKEGNSSGSTATSGPSKTIEEEIGEIVESFEDIDEIGNVFDSNDQDDFMNRAIDEAMKEAKEASSGELSESILNDKEMMKEIEKVFEDANKKLLESVEEIRKEQTQMSRADAEARTESMKDEEIRLAEAEGSISRLVDKVSEEKSAVESAIRDLEKAKNEMNEDPLVKVANLRNAGIAKQGVFALSLFFALRSLTDLVLIVGPNSQSHAIASIVQAGIAIVLAFIFFL